SNVDGDEIEVVFVSFDSTSLEYNEYKSTMPWPAVPFENLNQGLLVAGVRDKVDPNSDHTGWTKWGYRHKKRTL
ncbi:hypothetical protein THAOC_30626, partial [Thalassiosira oceanica]